MLKTYSVCLYLRRSLVTSASHWGTRSKPDLHKDPNQKNEEEGEMDRSGPKILNTFAKLNKWKSQATLVDHLKKNVVFYNPKEDEHGLVVINKPYGLPIKKAEDSEYCLEGCIGALATLLGEKQLHVIKSVERFCSGIVLLGTSEDTEKHMLKSVKKSKTKRMLTSGYIGLVMGHAKLPAMDTGQVLLEECPSVEKPLFSDRHKEPVIYRNLSTTYSAIQRRNAKLFHMGADLIANSGTHPVSLVRLDPGQVKNHFPSVWLADQGHPLLGDHMYDYRSSSLMGHKVKVGLKHTQASRMQKLPPTVRERLELKKGEEWKIPKHLHHHRIHLPDFLGKGKDLTVRAPLPPHFIKSCQVLGVQLNWKEIVENDQVKVWPAKEKKKKEKDDKAPHTDLQQNLLELE